MLVQSARVKRDKCTRLLTAATLTCAVGVAAATYFGSSPSANAASTQSVTILESTPGFFDIPIHVAESLGAKYHVNVKLIQVQGGGAAGTEFEGGTADILVTALDTGMRLQMAHSISGGLSVIGSNMHTMLYALCAKTGSSIKSVAQLRGKTIGISGPLSAGQVTVAWVLKTKYHINPSSVKWVALGSMPSTLAAVQKGTVDTAVLFAPSLEQGLDNKSIKIIFDLRKFPYGQNVFFGRNKQIKTDPSKYADFMKAYTAAVDKLEHDPKFALAQARKYYGAGLSNSTLKSMLKFYLDKEWNQTAFTKASYIASKKVELSSGTGFAPKTFPTFASITEDTPKS